MLCLAYGVSDMRIRGGPKWFGTDPYDVVAKTPENVNGGANFQQMLQHLLEERFQLVVHKDVDEVPAYRLVLAKGGSRVQPSGTSPQGGHIGGGPGRIDGNGQPISRLARRLEDLLRRPVVDGTDLKGLYDFDLRFEPLDGYIGGQDIEQPALFAAIREQLGLELQKSKEKIEVIVIDRAEKPSGN